MDRIDLNTLLDNLPQGVSEADLLDLVEGTPGERAQALASLEVAHPALARLVADLSADRTALQDAPRPAPSPQILAGVRTQIEAEALAEPEVDYIPVSQVEPARAGVLVRFTEFVVTNPAGRRLSVAAGFALAGGLAIWGGLQLVSTTTSSQGPGTLAQGDPAPTTVAEADPAPIQAPVGEPAPIEIATTDIAPPEITIDPIETMPAPITVARAADAAATGRLAIRIAGLAPEITSTRVAEIARSGSAQVGAWGSLASDSENALRTTLGMTEPAETLAPAFTNDTTSQATTDATSAFAMRLGASSEALDAFIASCEARGLTVQLIELDEPTPVEPPHDPRDVVWWTRTPDTWLPSVVVPVLIEQD